MKQDSCYKSLTPEFLDETFQWFLPVIEKLKKEGFSGEFYWWRSRFSEALGYGGNMKDEAWELAHTRDIAFPYIWNKYRHLFSTREATGKELAAMPKTFQLQLF